MASPSFRVSFPLCLAGLNHILDLDGLGLLPDGRRLHSSHVPELFHGAAFEDRDSSGCPSIALKAGQKNPAPSRANLADGGR
jgi:hypothetical protein